MRREENIYQQRIFSVTESFAGDNNTLLDSFIHKILLDFLKITNKYFITFVKVKSALVKTVQP